jgi:hypothetical protein
LIKKGVTLTGILLLAAATLPADFSYQETSTITGGALASMMKMAGAFSRQAREPMRATIAVKGDRMAHRTEAQASIIDLAAQTVTNIDLKKKTYSVMTFDQMREMLAQLSQRAKEKDAPEMNVKVSADSTGKTRQIAGFNAKEIVIKMEMETADPKSGQKATTSITTDMWIAPTGRGYEEVRSFQKRMAEKLNWAPGGGMLMSNPEVMKGMAQVIKEMGKLDGMPVFMTMSMGGPGMPGAVPAGAGETQSGDSGRPTVKSTVDQAGSDAVADAGDRAGDATANATGGGRLGSGLGSSVSGALGRFGGFGRKKKQPQQEASAAQPAAKAAAPQGASSSGSLLEMQTEYTGFSAGAVDGSQFEVPAGFKKVEPDMKRGR